MTIRTTCTKCVILLVEGNWVDGVAIAFLSVSFKVKDVFELKFIEIYFDNTTSAFNTSYNVNLFTFTASHGACFMIQERLLNNTWIKLTSKNVFQIPNVDPFLRMSCHKHWISQTHILNRLANPRLTNFLAIYALNLVKLDDWVPSSRNQKDFSICNKASHVFHWCLMTADYYRLLSILRIPSVNISIWMRHKNGQVTSSSWKVFYPTYAKHRSICFYTS